MRHSEFLAEECNKAIEPYYKIATAWKHNPFFGENRAPRRKHAGMMFKQIIITIIRSSSSLLKWN